MISSSTPTKKNIKVKLGEEVPVSAKLVKIEKQKVKVGTKHIRTDSYYDIHEDVPIYEEVEFAFYEV